MTYYRNVFTIEMLSSDPWLDSLAGENLANIEHEMTYGGSSGQVARTVTNEEVTAARMAELLTAQGSDPVFLLGDEAGECAICVPGQCPGPDCPGNYSASGCTCDAGGSAGCPAHDPAEVNPCGVPEADTDENGMTWADRCTAEDPCPVRAAQGGLSCGH